MYRVVIFDFFGVFCPDIAFEWFKKAVPGYAEKLTEYQTICAKSDYGKLSKDDFYKEISRLTDVPVDKIKKDIDDEIVIDEPLVAFVKGLVNKGYRIACLSNGTREWTLEVMIKHDLTGLFEEIVLSGDLGIVKPDLKIYDYTLNKLSIDAAQALFIDDRKMNADAAEVRGIRSIVFKDTATFIRDFEAVTRDK